MIKRKELKGYPQYLKYAYGDVVIDRIGGKEVYRDYLVEKWAKDNKEKYYKALKKYFSDFESFDELTDEEIYGGIYKLRKRYLDDEFFETIRKIRIENLKAKAKGPFSKDIKKAFLDILFYDIQMENRDYDTPIDRWDILKERVIDKASNLILIPGHYLMIPYIFSFLSVFNTSDRKIILLLKDESIYNEPIEEDLKQVSSKFSFEIYRYHSNGVGLDVNSLPSRLVNLSNKDYETLGFGEKMLFSLHNAPFSYFIGTHIKASQVRIYTNIQPVYDDKIPYILSYIPKREIPAEDFLGVERVKKTLFHFEKTKNMGQNAILPYYFNFYSTTFSPKKFKDFRIDSEKNMIEVLKKRDSTLFHIIDKRLEKHGRYIKSYYNLENMENTPYPLGAKEWQNGVLVTGLVLDNLKVFQPRVILSEHLGYGKISPRTLIKRGIIGDRTLFYFNFLYFFTEKLIKDYNYIRKELPYENIEDKEFFLGYRYIRQDNFETFPLYNKGFFGYTEEGTPIFGRRKLEGGKIEIAGVMISWDKDMVNPIYPQDFCIYTPFIKNKELGKRDIDYMRFSYPVGENRFNIIIVNDKIIAIRDGDVLLPSVGVVLSFSKKSIYVQKLKEKLLLAPLEDGYYKIRRPYSINIKLNPPSLIPPHVWKRTKWVYGGGTLLVQNGKNLVKNKEDAEKAFWEEGWYHPLSKRTQETQVQEWVRGPRNIIGITDSGRFFVMTFSGRTKESRGVCFDEAIKIIEKEIVPQKIQYALNLDGGSSVCLGFIENGEFFELNYPAPSPTTPAGMVRPVNSMMILEKVL